MRAFDFDQTIYDGYSYRDFCFFVTARRPWLAFYLPVIIVVALLKACRLISMKRTVEIILWPYLRFKKIDEYIVKFWDKKEKRIQQWYKDIHSPDDLIISATPSFFLEEICRRIGVTNLIATEIDRKTGKVVDPYCYREGKWQRFIARYGEDAKLTEYYTDTMRDEFMLGKAERGFFVKNGRVTQVH
ncbi:MAG TPA: haloacid dehalogenase-like hydrolase [Firmicutes bacterium]|nr:haloacid dehalogenase-like hydrolase [Bacillota bacterium]